jgi:hypothetical protein
VQVADTCGLDSRKVGTVRTPRLDHRGIPRDVAGAYNPFDFRRERYIQTDDGEYITMFTVCLREVPRV